MSAKTKLVAGPYRPPKRVEIGDLLQTPEGNVRVDLLLPTAIGPWPASHRAGHGSGGKPIPILHGDLVAAVRTESAQAVAAAWGVSRWTVQRWRRRLGVGRFTAGTTQLWRELAPRRLRGAKK
jgi:hypothetical protein